VGHATHIEEFLKISPVLPVVTFEETASACDLARALLEGGIAVMEVTLRTAAGLRAIEAIARGVPQVRVGAGSVMRAADLHAAADAGASFAVSPGATAALLSEGRGTPIPYLPAIATASELMIGMDAGYDCFKYFPAASAGGLEMLGAFAGPFPQARFCPTGGITDRSLASYLALPNVLCVGGSWLTPPDAMASHDWARITKLASAACGVGRGGRKDAPRDSR
jgi:2-dehydro-3-deoxyphosphogluconate aldolase / (4S)-4-hydroxy-2-oxoglutarate aldolase